MLDRRAFLHASLWVAAAPMIVRASSLIKVRALKKYPVWQFITSNSAWSNVPVDLTAAPPLESMRQTKHMLAASILAHGPYT